jgi:hypothetical protein
MTATGDDLVTVATFGNTAEAELARERLANEGVEAFVLEGVTGGVMPFLAANMGGVHLQVRDRDHTKAREILSVPASP